MLVICSACPIAIADSTASRDWDHRGGTVAVLLQLGEGLVASLAEVLFHAAHELFEMIARNPVAVDGVAQALSEPCGLARVRWSALVGGGEQFVRLCQGSGAFVG